MVLSNISPRFTEIYKMKDDHYLTYVAVKASSLKFQKAILSYFQFNQQLLFLVKFISNITLL